MTRAERDAAIARGFRDGATRFALAECFGLTPRRIGQIAKAHGIHRRTADQIAMGLLNRGGRPRDAGIEALGADRHFYAKARRYYGAAEARRMFGIAA